ncbi:MAG: site-specific integrase, partial [Planctomycetales bacterium]
MASIFKLGRDKGKKNACWYYQYIDHEGRKRVRKGFTDKSLTVQAAAKAEHDVRMRKTGLIDPQQEQLADRRKSAIREHLDEYRKSLRTKETTEKHAKLTLARVERVIEGCGFRTLGNIDADAVESFLADLREEEDLGHRTYNHYVQAVEGFCNWLVARKRLTHNPVIGIPRLNAETDVRHARRALSPEEFGKLVQAARDSGILVQCYGGETRARIYILSYMTGLRKGEIASLTRDSFSLDVEQPTLTVQAGASKHRRKDVLPLHPELVSLLREWIPTEGPLFPELARRKTWLMVKKDLELAGIPYETAAGIADFHAAGRHTHITELLRNGASLPEAKELARHQDVKMTMRYTHIGIDDQARALKRLPCQHIVSKSDFSGCQQPSAGGGNEESGNEETPDGVRGSVVSCQSVSEADSMEAAGIEPASCDPSVSAST